MVEDAAATTHGISEADRLTPLVYIVGVGRSGSTLLDLLLAQHPDIAGVGEFANFTDWVQQDDPCTCGQAVTACDVWGPVLAEVPDATTREVSFGAGFRLQLRRALRCLTGGLLAPSEQATADLNAELLSRMARATGAAHVVDSSKDLGRACMLSMSGRFDMRIIHLVRDARGVVYSRAKKADRERFAKERPDFASRVARRPERKQARTSGFTYRRWMAFNLAIVAVGLLRWRRRYRLVLYEDLAAAPEAVVADLYEWLGAGEAGQALDDRPTGADAHNIGGNRMRLRPVTEIRVDDEWRRSLRRWPRLLYFLLGAPFVAALCRATSRRHGAPDATHAEQL